MTQQFHPSSPTPRPEGVVEALASSPPIARRRRLNSCSSGAGQVTGIAGWRRVPVPPGRRSSTLGMGMQSTPAKRSKSIDTIPWDSAASRKTGTKGENDAESDEVDVERPQSGSDTPQQSSRGLSMTQWHDPLETTSEPSAEVYQDLEVPLKFGTSSAAGASAVSPAGGDPGLDEDQVITPRGRVPSDQPSGSSATHYDTTAPLNDEIYRTPTSAERRTSSKIASRQLTPRPRFDLPPSDPPWSSTPSVLRDSSSSKRRRRDASSPLENRRWRDSSPPPWEMPLRATPPSPLHFDTLRSESLPEFEMPSSIPLARHEYNAEREERALQPDPFGFSRIQAMVEGALRALATLIQAGRVPQVFLPSSQGEELSVRVYTPVSLSSPPSSPSPAGPERASPHASLHERHSTPETGPPNVTTSPPQKQHYWLGSRVYRRMERLQESDSENSDGESSGGSPGKDQRKTRAATRQKTVHQAAPELDHAALDARAARLAHFEEIDKHYNLTVEYVWY